MLLFTKCFSASKTTPTSGDGEGVQYGDLELFLAGLKLSHLIPSFQVLGIIPSALVSLSLSLES